VETALANFYERHASATPAAHPFRTEPGACVPGPSARMTRPEAASAAA